MNTNQRAILVSVHRYYHSVKQEDYFYIALELAECSLEDYSGDKSNYPDVDDVDILRQAAEGLAWLHSRDISKKIA